jgi:Ca-activated chloride channel family protein
MPDWASTWLPFHWLRPWALWGLLLALFILIWGRRPPSQQHLRGVIDAHLLPHLLVHRGRAGWRVFVWHWPGPPGSARRRRWHRSKRS